MKLSQILIEAGVTPDWLVTGCLFIAQEKKDGFTCQYSDKPELAGDSYKRNNIIRDCFGGYLFNLAEDWQTPLSFEQFIADYEAHCAKRP